jgi:tol-pal system protein YbgF
MRVSRSLARLAAACALASVGAASLAGCARSAEERQLEAMRDEIDKLQRDRDTEDRKTGLLASEEAEVRAQASGRAAGPDQGAPSDAVTIGVDGVPAADDDVDPEDPTPRPSIRILGSPHSRGAWRGDDRVEQSVANDGVGSVARPSALDPEAKPAYDAALALVTAHKYDAALDALAAFLVRWPDHPYADNAMYWRGECYFARGDFARAAEQFQGVVDRFPAGNKAPDALLKLALCAQRTGDAPRAREIYGRLANDYPQSAAARRIPPVTTPAVTPPGPSSEDHR